MRFFGQDVASRTSDLWWMRFPQKRFWNLNSPPDYFFYGGFVTISGYVVLKFCCVIVTENKISFKTIPNHLLSFCLSFPGKETFRLKKMSTICRRSIAKCHYMSLHIPKCGYMSLYVTLWHYISLYVTICRYMSL